MKLEGNYKELEFIEINEGFTITHNSKGRFYAAIDPNNQYMIITIFKRHRVKQCKSRETAIRSVKIAYKQYLLKIECGIEIKNPVLREKFRVIYMLYGW